VDPVKQDRFYILPHGQIGASVAVRMKDIVEGPSTDLSVPATFVTQER